MNIVFVESLGMCECTINKSLATLKNQGHTVTFYHDRNENEEVLIERAQNAEVVVVSNIPLRKHFFENCPKLRMLSVAFTGVDHIDLEECKKRGITVCNAAGYSTEAVAELTIGMMIAVYRKMVGRRCHSPYRRRPAGSPGKRTSRKNSRYRRARSHRPTGSSVSQRFRMQGFRL